MEAFRCRCGAVIRYQLHLGDKTPSPECTNPNCCLTLDDLEEEMRAEVEKRANERAKARHEMDQHKWIRKIKS